MRTQPSRAGIIAMHCAIVNLAVDLDNKLEFVAEEVRDKRAEWMLTPKLESAKLPVAQVSPENTLRWRTVLA